MLMSLVKPGVVETRARPSLPAKVFNNDDLPTLDRPMKANSGSDSSGHESRSGALQSKMADEMCMIGNLSPWSQQIGRTDTPIFRLRPRLTPTELYHAARCWPMKSGYAGWRMTIVNNSERVGSTRWRA